MRLTCLLLTWFGSPLFASAGNVNFNWQLIMKTMCRSRSRADVHLSSSQNSLRNINLLQNEWHDRDPERPMYPMAVILFLYVF